MNLRDLQILLSGKKTYITASIAILGTVLAFASGQIEAVPAIQMILGSLLATFIRSGSKSDRANRY